MRNLVLAPVLAALVIPAAAEADYQVAVHIGKQTVYIAADNGGSTTFKIRRTVPGVTLHRGYDHSALLLSGTVRNTSTVPMGSVPITAQVASVVGQGWRTVGTATSNVNGRFVVRVPRGDSRLVRLFAGFTYLTFKELVSPTLRLHVRPIRHARLRFTGAIRINWLQYGPPTVEIESRTLNGWATLAAIKVGRLGTFGYTYRSPAATKGFRFRFRLTTLPTADWSWGSSPLASATVR